MLKNVSEVFDEFEAKTKKAEKIEVLRRNQNYALKNILRGNFDPNVQFVIDKPVQYKISDAPVGLGYTSIHQELSRAYLFEKNNPKVDPNLSQQRKEVILAQILEALEAREAEIYQAMLLKKLKVKGLTYDIVKEAFPDLLP